MPRVRHFGSGVDAYLPLARSTKDAIIDTFYNVPQFRNAGLPIGTAIKTNGGHNEEAWFLNMYNPAGKFTISKEPIPEISDLTLAIRREVEKNKSDQMIKDLQRKLAAQMPNFLLPGYAVGFTLNQPWLKNFGVFVSGDLNPSWSSARIYTEYWYDESAHRRGA